MIDYRENNNWKVYVHIVPKEISGYEYDKYYVGITSRKPVDRWDNGHGYRLNTHFYNAIKKYGWNNIIHEIIAEHLTKDEACKMEISLINKLLSFNQKYGYNKTLGGEGFLCTEEQKDKKSKSMRGEKNHYYGKKHSEETKKLIREHHYDCSGGNHAQAKEVFQFTIDGMFVAKYPSGKEATLETGINRKGISNAAIFNKTAGGFLWIYSDNVIYDFDTYKIKEYKYIPKKLTNKEVYQFDLNGNYIAKYESCVQASNITGVSKNSISDEAKNKYKTHKKAQFLWRYKEDVKELEVESSSFILLR